MMLRFLFLFISITISGFAVCAKKWNNTYVEFDLPNNWNCLQQGTEFVCRSTQVTESKEAAIVVTAKLKGPSDTLPEYMRHLSTPQSILGNKPGTSVTSSVRYPPKFHSIEGTMWVDGLHDSSEIPDYYTRYMGTVKDNLAILYTISIYKPAYSKYHQMFDGMVKSLRTRNVTIAKGSPGTNPPREGFGSPSTEPMPNLVGTPLAPQKSAWSLRSLLIILALLLALIGSYLYWKSRNKTDPPPEKK